jgi:small subunit ribosomal protein S8
MTDPIADMLTRIRNAAAVNSKSVMIPHSKVKAEIAATLKKEGYIGEYIITKQDTAQPEISVQLKYSGKHSVITKIQRVSKPGRRVYIKSKHIKPILSGHGSILISTSQGIMTGKDAKFKQLGGEVLCRIW